MRATIKSLALAALFILTACSAQHVATQQYPAAGFPFRHSDFDYKVAWKTTEANNSVFIDGILKNVRYPYIESLDMAVFLLGTDGKVRARASTIPTPQQSQTGEVIPFTVELRNTTLNPGDTFKFLVHYQADLGGPEGGIDWRSTFAVDAVTGAALHKDSLKPEEW
jgi:hypothetical protein